MKQSKFKKKYKALMLDVDGTLVTFDKNARPSKKVIAAIKKAQKKIKVGLATSRPYFDAKEIINLLELNAPCILSGGPQIFDPVESKFIWEKIMDAEDVEVISQKLSNLNIEFHFNIGSRDIEFTKEIPTTVYHIWVQGIKEEKISELEKFFSHIHTISINKTTSWKKGLIDLIISHGSATKQHGIMEVAKVLKISTKDIIGVGDHYNDFPLFMACGLKIAMGNAVPDLKEIADYIAPTVYEDGVVDVIERFIL